MAVGGMFTFLDAKALQRDIDKAIVRLNSETMKVFAGIVEEAFVTLVLDTPQWSGYLAASWNMTINRKSNRTADKGSYPYTDNPYEKGMMPAIADALSRAEGKTSFQGRFGARGTSIHVTNNVPYADLINAGAVPLRTEVGHNPGFFDRFIYRVQHAHAYMSDGTWDYYANTNFLGQGYR